MRRIGPAWLIGVITLSTLSLVVSCSSVAQRNALLRSSLRSAEGLIRVDRNTLGILDVHESHGIGRYDGLVVPEASLSYRRGSERLTDEAEAVFLRLLRQSLVEASTAAAIPVEADPAECVMEIRLAVSKLNLNVLRNGRSLAEMIMVMEFRDSTSRELLLRYATPAEIENPEAGVAEDTQLRRGLDRIVADLDLSRAVDSEMLASDYVRSGCNGTLAARGRAARERGL